MVFTPTTTGNQAVHINPLNSDLTGWWGAQLEQGAFPTSYIPTTSATVTRAADNLVMSTTGWVNNSEGTLYANIRNQTNLYAGIASIDDGSHLNVNQHLYSSNYIYGESILSGSTLQINQPALLSQTNKVAYASKPSLYAISVNGQPVTTSGHPQALTIPNKFWIGIDRWHGNYFNGNIEKIKYYPTRISNTQLQLLTQ